MTGQPSPTMSEIFPALAQTAAGSRTLTNRQRADYAYFGDALPGFPDPTALRDHAEAMNEMSETGMLFYLDYLLGALEADPWGHDMVFHHLEGWLDFLATRVPHRISSARLRLNRITTRRFSPRPDP